MKYKIKATTRFSKDMKRIQKQGKNLDKLFVVIDKLANGETLEQKYKDHALSGNYEGFRDCHIEPDWLLIYMYDDGELILYLSRTGSHSDLL